jgi:hypothetical protein
VGSTLIVVALSVQPLNLIWKQPRHDRVQLLANCGPVHIGTSAEGAS